MTLDDVLDALEPPKEPPRLGGHSPLYEALWAAYEELVPHLDPPRRPNWQALAARLAAKGVVDGQGKEPTGERTRKVWWKVGRDKEMVASGTARRRRRRAGPQEAPEATGGAQPPPGRPPRKAAPGGEDGDVPLDWAGEPDE